MARSGCIYGPFENEEWRPVPGHGGAFVASSLGRVARVLGHLGASGYMQISMEKVLGPIKGTSEGRKRRYRIRAYAHHLVALAFHEYPPEGKTFVNHKDENRANNRPENLEWCTQAENLAHTRRLHPDTVGSQRPWKYTVEQWQEVIRLKSSGISIRKTAAILGMTAGAVRWVLKSPNLKKVAA